MRLALGVPLSAQRFSRAPEEVRALEGDVVAEAARVVRTFILDANGP